MKKKHQESLTLAGGGRAKGRACQSWESGMDYPLHSFSGPIEVDAIDVSSLWFAGNRRSDTLSLPQLP